MKKLITAVLISAMATTLLSACGWHLRGSSSIPMNLDSVYVTAEDRHGALITELQRALISNEVALAKSSTDAQYSLQLSNEKVDRRTVSVGHNALAAEYELNMSVDFRILNPAGEIIAPMITASTYRSYTFDINAVVAKAEEERLIEREMRNNLVQQILRRLHFVSQEQASQEQSNKPASDSAADEHATELDTNGQTAP